MGHSLHPAMKLDLCRGQPGKLARGGTTTRTGVKTGSDHALGSGHKESNSRGTTWSPPFLAKISQFFAAAGISREPRTLCSAQKSSKALEVRDFSDR